MSVELLLTSLIIVATPGTGALYTVAAGLSRGGRASVVAALGCTLGVVPHMVAAITGLAALLNASATAFQVFKFAGVAYLLFMVLSMLRDKDPLAVPKDEQAVPGSGQVIRTAILLNLLNPKLTIFFFAFLPQFVKPGSPDATLHMLVPSAIFMVLTFIVFVAYGKFAAAFRDRVVNRPHVATWIRRGFAACFAALALVLAFSAE